MQFMLLANMAVARRIVYSFPDSSLLRRHPPPNQRKLDELLEFCRHIGLQFDASSARALQRSLEEMEKKLEPDVAMGVKLLLTKPMQLAKYFCTGEINMANWRHFALSVDHYTHFTSPIRRYADVIVHRLLGAALQAEESFKIAHGRPEEQLKALDQIIGDIPTMKDVVDIALHCNKKKLAAKLAQEQCDRIYLCVMVKDKPLQEDAIVINVQDRSLDVYIPRLGIEKRVYADPKDDNMTVSDTVWDEKQRSLSIMWIGDTQWRTYTFFTRVIVQVGMRPNKVPIELAICILPNGRTEPPPQPSAS